MPPCRAPLPWRVRCQSSWWGRGEHEIYVTRGRRDDEIRRDTEPPDRTSDRIGANRGIVWMSGILHRAQVQVLHQVMAAARNREARLVADDTGLELLDDQIVKDRVAFLTQEQAHATFPEGLIHDGGDQAAIDVELDATAPTYDG